MDLWENDSTYTYRGAGERRPAHGVFLRHQQGACEWTWRNHENHCDSGVGAGSGADEQEDVIGEKQIAAIPLNGRSEARLAIQRRFQEGIAAGEPGARREIDGEIRREGDLVVPSNGHESGRYGDAEPRVRQVEVLDLAV